MYNIFPMTLKEYLFDVLSQDGLTCVGRDPKFWKRSKIYIMDIFGTLNKLIALGIVPSRDAIDKSQPKRKRTQ